MTVTKPLQVVARSQLDVTMAMELKYYDTEFNITMSRCEALEIIRQLKVFTDSFDVHHGPTPIEQGG
jgi:hypothetical protein